VQNDGNSKRTLKNWIDQARISGKMSKQLELHSQCLNSIIIIFININTFLKLYSFNQTASEAHRHSVSLSVYCSIS